MIFELLSNKNLEKNHNLRLLLTLLKFSSFVDQFKKFNFNLIKAMEHNFSEYEYFLTKNKTLVVNSFKDLLYSPSLEDDISLYLKVFYFLRCKLDSKILRLIFNQFGDRFGKEDQANFIFLVSLSSDPNIFSTVSEHYNNEMYFHEFWSSLT